MILKEVRNLLLENSSVTDIVGDRIYPLKLPETPGMPCIRMSRISETTDPTIQTHTSRVQLSCYALSYEGVVTLAQTIRTALLNKTRVNKSITILGITAAGIGVDNYEADTRRYFASEDVMVAWRFT